LSISTKELALKYTEKNFLCPFKLINSWRCHITWKSHKCICGHVEFWAVLHCWQNFFGLIISKMESVP